MVEQRDYTLIIDRSGSMATKDAGALSRWQAVQESTLALAARCEQLDPDGLTVYFFSSSFQRVEGVKAALVAQLFAANSPNGSTNLAGVLAHAFDDFFERKAAGRLKPSGETILVITDGVPDNEESVVEVIVKATHKMDRDEELAVSFLQIGQDDGARAFLRRLDDELVSDKKPGFFGKLFGAKAQGARFDICDTLTFDDLEDRSLTQVLLDAIRD